MGKDRQRDIEHRTPESGLLVSVGLLAAIIFTSLAFGAVEPWSVGLFCGLVVGLLLLWAVKMGIERRVKIFLPVAGLPLVALIVYTVVQSLTFERGDGSFTSLSLDVEATRAFLPVLICLVAAFGLAANVITTSDRVEKFYQVLTFYGLLYAVFALTQNLAGEGKLIWLHDSASGFGSFVNRNHFAGFMEMLVPLPFALMVTGVIRKEARLVYAFIGLLMAVALAVSLSRGGIISLVASMAFMAVLSTRGERRERSEAVAPEGRRGWLKRAAGVTAIIVTVMMGVGWLAAEKALTRVVNSIDQANLTATSDAYYGRTWVWRRSALMARDHALFGVGLGAYATAFPMYDDSASALVVAHAHNDYLQILTDGGAIGALLALLFLTLILRAIWRAAAVKDRVLRAAALGSSASVFAILVHSLFDFNLQIPANALLFLIHCAIVTRIAAQPHDLKNQTAMVRNLKG